jgi:hypothetical protein
MTSNGTTWTNAKQDSDFKVKQMTDKYVESLIKTNWTTLRLFLIYLSFEYYNDNVDGDGDGDNVRTTMVIIIMMVTVLEL